MAFLIGTFWNPAQHLVRVTRPLLLSIFHWNLWIHIEFWNSLHKIWMLKFLQPLFFISICIIPDTGYLCIFDIISGCNIGPCIIFLPSLMFNKLKKISTLYVIFKSSRKQNKNDNRFSEWFWGLSVFYFLYFNECLGTS